MAAQLDQAPRLIEGTPRQSHHLEEVRAGPVFEKFGELIKLFAELRPPKSPFGWAMTSATNPWEARARSLEVPEAE